MAKRPAFSNLCKSIEAGHFVFTGELEPKKILNLEEIIHSAKEMKKTGRIVAANVTDGPQGDGLLLPMLQMVLKVMLICVQWYLAILFKRKLKLKRYGR
jgi:hypothetical protein